MVSPESIVHLSAALLGAVVGGVISWVVASRAARRERCARYGERLMESFLSAHRKVARALSELEASAAEALPARLAFPDEATAIWTQAEIASRLEWSRSTRRAMQGWAVTHFDALYQGATTKAQRQWLERLLDLGLYLVIAWTVCHATGADFRRPADESPPCSLRTRPRRTPPTTDARPADCAQRRARKASARSRSWAVAASSWLGLEVSAKRCAVPG